ncbi:tail fiber domain-containing protein [Bizionia myxarmorum]|uniref:Tail fiber domain-containing protein n=1 Tax=Bizionia myxarmorum TaxID=291186 RepID=A0A5D0RFI9_9FLAO|nr:tail fiber domain-containing protein [Bizionia myxarmorum]TYB79829.1 tail fiber domain-containing protein [Bizionia myxarmorum]
MFKITSFPRILFVFIFMFVLQTEVFAQVGIGTTSPAPGAVLDVTSTNKGFLVPRVDIADLSTIAPVTGGTTAGLLVWNTNATTGIGYHYWNGSRWIPFGNGGINWALIGNAATTANFIGTTNNTPLNVRTNNIERMRILGNGNIGIRTTTPSNMFQMTNGGLAVGANAMASFDNLGTTGVSLSGYNSSTNNPYNSIEGVTNYNGTTYVTSGVFGLAINASLTHQAIGVRGAANGRDGIGVYGTRQNVGGILGWGGLFVNDLGYTGFFGTISDEKTKKNISQIQDALYIVKQLKPVTYYFDLEKYPNMGLNDKMEYGFIAQEVRDVLPEVTRIKALDTNATSENIPYQMKENKNESFVVLDYTRIIPILTKGMQEQQKIIETQNDRIFTLEVKIIELESRMNVLIKRQN